SPRKRLRNPGYRFMKIQLVAAVVMASFAAGVGANESMHSHPAPRKLGTVHFANSCAAAVQGAFDRAVALLHSFAYDVAAREFNAIAVQDPGCAMAHWGVAMAEFHQLWDPPKTDALQVGLDQLLVAHRIGAQTAQEREFIAAAATYFS